MDEADGFEGDARAGCIFVAQESVQPRVRRAACRAFGGLGVASLIGGNAQTPLEVLANPVGPDSVGCGRSYPLKLRRLEGSWARWNAPIANGYCTGCSETKAVS